ncbi:CT1975-like family protein [Lacticaseibacillus brantae DSM 23927]|uniref:CT1975-like family protein n=1 Tax=Lacticaseibacillus brantae DSM 23927 TaxID=1423727 RepID=A0A0R2AXL7_9LACO|nr:CT1975-like family protein [Lacticaseibacillus brantae DSM 23927]
MPTASLTKDTFKLLVDKLLEVDSSLDAEAAAQKATDVFAAAKVKLDKDNKTKALMFVSPGQIEKIAQFATDNDSLDSKELQKVFKNDQSLDLALFGRMVADNPELNVDASAQVAHALSTHEIVPEFDYFTAVDDEQGEDQSGSAMIGTIEFNSSTLYRYANINISELVHNLGDTDLTIDGAVEFIKQFLLSMPTGKQNTFANRTLPNYVMISVRQDTPVNLVSAFETPVKSRDGYVTESINRLDDEYVSAQQFVDRPLLTVVLGADNFDWTNQTEVSSAANLNDLLASVKDSLAKAVQDEDIND